MLGNKLQNKNMILFVLIYGLLLEDVGMWDLLGGIDILQIVQLAKIMRIMLLK